jgi:hypothetical protein
VQTVEVDEDLLEVGVELVGRTDDLGHEVRTVVVVRVVYIVDLAERVLRNLPLVHPQQPLQSNVRHLRVIPQQHADLLQVLGRNVSLHLAVDGKPEGAFVEHEVHLRAQRHLFVALPPRPGGVAVPSPQVLRRAVLDVEIHPELVLLLDPEQVVVVVEAELVVDVERAVLGDVGPGGVVVVVVVAAHPEQELPDVVELAVGLLLEPRRQRVDVPAQRVEVDDVLLRQQLQPLEVLLALDRRQRNDPLLERTVGVPETAIVVEAGEVLELGVFDLDLDVVDRLAAGQHPLQVLQRYREELVVVGRCPQDIL